MKMMINGNDYDENDNNYYNLKKQNSENPKCKASYLGSI